MSEEPQEMKEKEEKPLPKTTKTVQPTKKELDECTRLQAYP